MFAFFERLHRVAVPPKLPEAPPGALAFYWHSVADAKALFTGLFVAGFFVALIDAATPVFIGTVVSIIAASSPADFFEKLWPSLSLMASILFVGRPLAMLAQNLFANQAIAANVAGRITWQSHWYVMRKAWRFFQRDFVGRIANQVLQTGPAVRELLVMLLTSVWHILVYGTSALVLLASVDVWLAVPVALWFVGYLALLRTFVPRLRSRARAVSEARSNLSGRMTDSYTNILTIKLFDSANHEDAHVRRAIGRHAGMYRKLLRLNTLFSLLLSSLNSLLVISTTGFALELWRYDIVGVGAAAMSLPLVWQFVNISGAVAGQVIAVFENVGSVQESVSTIAHPIAPFDKPGAPAIRIERGEISFEDVQFGYAGNADVLDRFTLHVRPGERIGLIGRSGAGKSTIVNLLLRLFDLTSGRILIDGQDIANVTQGSLRSQISVVSQDTTLFHRSTYDNIRYGSIATEAEVVAAAKLAHADEFIRGQADRMGRRGYNAYVGDRGVELSAGQRQRIAIARAILRAAPILVFDEATSALDAELEAAIAASMNLLTSGKTVIAIAHRLSTIARMDRLVVLHAGRIVEQGSHSDLLRLDGHYAALWRDQIGSFIDTRTMDSLFKPLSV